MSLKVLHVLIIVNMPDCYSVDPDEMQHYAAFHLCLQCLLKCPLRGMLCTNDSNALKIKRFAS